MSGVDNAWERIGNKALKLAEDILNKETAPTAETVEAVKGLVEIAVEIDTLNLLWVQKTRYGEAVFRDQAF